MECLPDFLGELCLLDLLVLLFIDKPAHCLLASCRAVNLEGIGMEVALWQRLGRDGPGKTSSFVANTTWVGAAMKGAKCGWLAVDIFQDIELSNRWPISVEGDVRSGTP